MEKKILALFKDHTSLKFSDIYKKLEIRSNLVAFHLKKLVAQGKIFAENGYYKLKALEQIASLDAKCSAIPIVLIHIGTSKKCVLQKRTQRPFLGLHGLPGGRILVGETPLQTAHRILKDKCNIIPTTISLTSMTTEHTTHKSKIIGTHIIFLFKATTKNPALQVVDKKTMIASDYQLLGTNQKKDEVLITELLDV